MRRNKYIFPQCFRSHWSGIALVIKLINYLDEKSLMKKIFILIFALVLTTSCAGPQKSVSFYERTPAEESTYVTNGALKAISEVHPDSKKEEVVILSNAKIVFADYSLLRKDFPELRNISNDEIDWWLLRNTAIMSKAQASQDVVNTPINSYETKSAYRPPDYGRALVIPVNSPGTENPIGLIDAKGVGALKPALKDHADGLATLGECIREFVYEKMVNRVFQHSNSGIKTVGTYAVIDAGFDLRHVDQTTSPAGIVLRQAHNRYEGKGSLFSDDDSLKIEKVLRHYGLTSAGAYRHDPVERINIQGTKSGAVLDFGGFLAVEKFTKPGKNFYRYRDPKLLIDPNLPGFVQPDESVRVPLNIWGTTVSGKEDPKLDNVWLWSHDLAKSFRNGTASRQDANQHVKNLLGPVFEKLKLSPVGGSSDNCVELINSIIN